MTTGNVDDQWKEVKKSGGKNTNYFVKFSFIDDRTNSLLPKIIQKYTKVIIDNKYQILPQDVINLCIEYIGADSIKCWYGPYEVKTDVNGILYNKLSKGGDINIKYDKYHPNNADITNMGCTTGFFLLFCYFCGPTVLAAICCLFYLEMKKTINNIHDEDERIGMYCIIGGVSIIITLLCTKIFFIEKGKPCCGCKEKNDLQIEWTAQLEPEPFIPIISHSKIDHRLVEF